MFEYFERLLIWLAELEADWSGPAPDPLPAGQRAVRERVNATAGRAPDRVLHEYFFALAQARGARPALLWGPDGALSHRELAGRALASAAGLREAGVQPGERVIVSLPRGPEQIVAVLGVLAAGAVYVPVGIEQPPARQAQIVANSGARWAIAPEPGGVPGVQVLTPGAARDHAPLSAPVPVDPGAVAYVIYTSGSTGQPKGVVVTHRAALGTVEAVNDRWSVDHHDRVLAVSALDFDLSVYDVFGLLDRGGALVLVGEDERREARALLGLVRRHQVTIWNSVPALLDMLLIAAEGTERFECLRLALVSGDWVGLDLPGRLREVAPEARFVALGGATEAAIWSNAFEVHAVKAAWRSVPYGHPLRNQRFRVVDPAGRDRPDYVPGELWIGGAGVAEGYHGDPGRTAEQFLTVDGERWYRTGDLGCYWADGTLEFLGRRDHQVKLRGHRIELGEVEAALRRHPGVSGGVALLIREPLPRLVAFVAGAVAETELRTLLAEHLPAYMVPEELHVLAELPLSANGKIDRRELARLATESADASAAEPPAGGLERRLAALWCSLLELEVVGRHDNFFSLGGDSVLATRMLECLRRELGIELTLRRLFAAPTVQGLAETIAAAAPGHFDHELEEGVV
jgi:yersiniabactin nonribosomal peptide synthetase